MYRKTNTGETMQMAMCVFCFQNVAWLSFDLGGFHSFSKLSGLSSFRISNFRGLLRGQLLYL